MIDLLVIGREVLQQFLAVLEERSRVEATRVPEQGDDATGTQDAGKLGPGPLDIKPVKRLSGDDEVHRGRLQRRGFGHRTDAVKTGLFTKLSFRRLTHLKIRLDGPHDAALPQKQLGRDPRSRTDVGHNRSRLQAGFVSQRLYESLGITRPVTDVIGHAV